MLRTSSPSSNNTRKPLANQRICHYPHLLHLSYHRSIHRAAAVPAGSTCLAAEVRTGQAVVAHKDQDLVDMGSVMLHSSLSLRAEQVSRRSMVRVGRRAGQGRESRRVLGRRRGGLVEEIVGRPAVRLQAGPRES